MWEEYLYAVLTATNSSHYVSPHMDVLAVGSPDAAAGYIGAPAPDNVSPISLKGSGSFNASVLIKGHNPHGVVPLFFGDQMDPLDWWDVTALSSLLCRITAGSAGASGMVKLITQSVRKQ
jgi:hypothetical protein